MALHDHTCKNTIAPILLPMVWELDMKCSGCKRLIDKKQIEVTDGKPKAVLWVKEE